MNPRRPHSSQLDVLLRGLQTTIPMSFAGIARSRGILSASAQFGFDSQEKLKDVKCGYPGCGRKGHTTDMCWNDPKNESKRPANFKPRTDSNVDTIEVLV